MEGVNSSESLANFEACVQKSDNNVNVDCSHFKGIAIASLQFSNLHCLNIQGSKMNTNGYSSTNRLDDGHVLAITRGIISANIPLLSLSLTNHHITDIGFESICTGLINRVQLLHLDLNQNNIVGDSIGALNLSSSRCPLRTLNLSCNPLSKTAGMMIANDLRMNQRLLSFEANNSGFSLSVIIAIATTLKQNTALEILKIDRPLIDVVTRQEEGVDHISRLLGSTFTRIQFLSLRYHCVGDLGASLLSSSLRNNKSLTHLDLERNKIGPSGCEALASHLILLALGSLRALLLSYNRVGDEGAEALAEVLLVNTNLRRLSLKSNNIDEPGLILICKALEINRTLKNISLFGNNFSDRSCEMFKNLSLTSLKNSSEIPLELDTHIYTIDGVFLAAEKEEILQE